MEWNQFKVFIIWAQVSKDLFEGVEFGTFSINICLVDLRKENLRWHDDGTQKSIDNSSQLNNPTLKKNCVTIVSVPIVKKKFALFLVEHCICSVRVMRWSVLTDNCQMLPAFNKDLLQSTTTTGYAQLKVSQLKLLRNFKETSF